MTRMSAKDASAVRTGQGDSIERSPREAVPTDSSIVPEPLDFLEIRLLQQQGNLAQRCHIDGTMIPMLRLRMIVPVIAATFASMTVLSASTRLSSRLRTADGLSKYFPD